MAERKYHLVKDQSLFRPLSIVPVYPLVTTLTFGLLQVYQMRVEDEDTICIVDAGYNEKFVYDQARVGHREKYFWKLNHHENPKLQAEGVARQFEIAVEIPNIPSFDPQFGQRGGWVTMKYEVLVRLGTSLEEVVRLRRAVNPLSTVQNIVRKIALRVLPLISYQEAMMSSFAEEIERQVQADAGMAPTGLRVLQVAVEGVAGSQQLAEEMQRSFGRLLEARDKRETALIFTEMEDNEFLRMLESNAPPEAALEFRSRQASQMLEAYLVSGKGLQEITMAAASAARATQKPDSLAQEVAERALGQIVEWPTPTPPTTTDHQERLAWERQLCQERVPTQLQPPQGNQDAFLFHLETGDEVLIVWWEPVSPPAVTINGRDRRSDYVTLSPGIYEYQKTTIWSIYWETRKLLGVRGNLPTQSTAT